MLHRNNIVARFYAEEVNVKSVIITETYIIMLCDGKILQVYERSLDKAVLPQTYIGSVHLPGFSDWAYDEVLNLVHTDNFLFFCFGHTGVIVEWKNLLQATKWKTVHLHDPAIRNYINYNFCDIDYKSECERGPFLSISNEEIFSLQYFESIFIDGRKKLFAEWERINDLRPVKCGVLVKEKGKAIVVVGFSKAYALLDLDAGKVIEVVQIDHSDLQTIYKCKITDFSIVRIEVVKYGELLCVANVKKPDGQTNIVFSMPSFRKIAH